MLKKKLYIYARHGQKKIKRKKGSQFSQKHPEQECTASQSAMKRVWLLQDLFLNIHFLYTVCMWLGVWTRCLYANQSCADIQNRSARSWLIKLKCIVEMTVTEKLQTQRLLSGFALMTQKQNPGRQLFFFKSYSQFSKNSLLMSCKEAIFTIIS